MQADLKQNVANYAVEVTNDTWQKVGQNLCMRVKTCFNGNGCHIRIVNGPTTSMLPNYFDYILA